MLLLLNIITKYRLTVTRAGCFGLTTKTAQVSTLLSKVRNPARWEFFCALTSSIEKSSYLNIKIQI